MGVTPRWRCFVLVSPQRRLSHTQKGEKIASTKMMNESQENDQTSQKGDLFCAKNFSPHRYRPALTVRRPIMLTVVRSHPLKIHSKPGEKPR